MKIARWHRRRLISRWLVSMGGLSVVVLLGACQPKIQLVAPEKPIVINLNIKIEQEVRVKVEREIDTLLETHPELF